MAELTYRGAVARGIAQEMRRDPTVVAIGEDIAAAGGVFKATVGLLDEFGPERVVDTPISEQAILGAAMGGAMTGLRPIAENHVQRLLRSLLGYRRQRDRQDPLHDGWPTLHAVRHPAQVTAAALASALSTPKTVENWAMAVPGLKVVAPSTPVDVVGLLRRLHP